MDGQLKQAINWYHTHGFRVFPVAGKAPIVEWGELFNRPPTVNELRDWFTRDGVKIGVATGYSGVIVVDADSRDEATWWYKNRPQTDMMVKTRRGVHFYYRTNGVEVRNRAAVTVEGVKRSIDLRGYGGYVVAPPSDPYQRIGTWDLSKVPTFDPEWIDTPVVKQPRDFSTPERAKDAAVKYISHIRAISGSCGHAETYRAAAVLIDRGMNATEALNALIAGNETNAEPKWTERELQHKVESAWGNIHR